ncbi:MAG TPA: tyrosine--tRNA ligase [Ferruginibacter sp.]|nr:tyrosine--tRNA ligase [Ferruginibacter sp.]HRO06150.1 tyrosine--tRNA ligase [Ferruginibacter sp.]HRO96543.1 tyrosine--tRNA ligase [Ferruginibacter sp.]HRP49709.1 tyrosine--tRNA ligase [Ferruginibacter sp.]
MEKIDLIQELTWRGMIQDIIPGTEEQLKKEMTTGYVGFDPTADSLHIGSLIPIILLKHLQRAGHKPLALIGGATGMVGDPSFKSEERHMLDEATLNTNLAGIRKQLEQFLDFNPSLPNAAEIVNNYDWFKGISFLDFIRDVGKHITVNYMMQKDSVKKRLEGQSGMSFTEFSYQLIQGYDFYWLYNQRNCKLQMGGSDQWGNIVTGTELVRRKAGGSAFALTCPLLKKADGGKFGKTEAGNVWLDANRTTPYQFYQFWLNASDSDAESWIKIFTFLPEAEIHTLIEQHRAQESLRLLQKKLAEEVTRFVHGEEALQQALATTQQLFGKADKPVHELSEDDLRSIEGIMHATFPAVGLQQGVDIISLVADTSIFPSRGKARKMIQNGGLSINRNKIQDPQQLIDSSWLLHEKFLLVQKGKKQFFLIEIQG